MVQEKTEIPNPFVTLSQTSNPFFRVSFANVSQNASHVHHSACIPTNITDSKPNECNELQRGLTSLISLRIPTTIAYRHWQHCNVQSVRVAGRVRRVGLMFHGQPPHLNFDELADSDKDESCGTPPGLTSSTRRGIRVPRTETATARNLRKDYTIKIAEPSDD